MTLPTVGRIVHYKLSRVAVEQIIRRRTTSSSIADRIKDAKWPLGVQAHIGNAVTVGEIYPLVIVRVWPDEFGPGVHGINGQVLLDGCDQFWVTSVREGNDVGEWSWPPRGG